MANNRRNTGKGNGLPQRRSIRLRGYDYRRAGLYFITICVQGRVCLFGEIRKGKMELNGAGQMVEKWYGELENKYPDKICHEMVVMPNHIHFIIENVPDIHGGGLDVFTPESDVFGPDADDHGDMFHPGSDAHVGAPLRGRPDGGDGHENGGDKHSGDSFSKNQNEKYGMHNRVLGATMGDAVGWFKTMTTNAYIRGVKQHGWQRFDDKLWQRNYYEHIIRNENAYHTIAEYIVNNPQKWQDDKFFNP